MKLGIILWLSVCLCACHVVQQKLTIQADGKINTGPENQALAVLMRAYLLTDDKKFTHASFDQLWHSDRHVLGATLLQRSEWFIHPGSYQQLYLKSNPRAQYIGVIALFRNPKLGHWRIIQALAPSYLQLMKPVYLQVKDNQLRWA